MKNRPAYIYGLIDPVTKQVRYIGWTCRDIKSRLWEHINEAIKLRKNSHKLSWIRSLLRKSLSPEVILLEYVDINSWAEAEQKWITEFREQGVSLTNATDGGQGNPGWEPSLETKQKLRQANLGKKQTEESNQKRSLTQKGKPKLKAQQRTPEENATVRANISKALKGTKKTMTPEQYKERGRKAWENRKKNGTTNNGWFPGCQSEEAKVERSKKIWDTRKERGNDKHSIKTCRKISELQKGKKGKHTWTPRWKGQNRSLEVIEKIILSKKHKAMNDKQVKQFKFLYPVNYSELLNVVNY